MEKQDLMYGALALGIIVVIALVVKPLATGQAIDIGLPTPTPVPTTPLPAEDSLDARMAAAAALAAQSTLPTPTPPTPTPAPTWNPDRSTEVGFVNPAEYGVSLNQTLPRGSRINYTTLDTNMTTFASINSENGASGTTAIMHIPFPYWELVYTVEPSKAPTVSKMEIQPTKGEGLSYSGISGSYSTAKSAFTIQVMDGDDPNRIVRTITPPGGIDLDLWTGASRETYENPKYTTKQKQTTEDKKLIAVDPRPWTEKFFEGERSYYFIITAQGLESYSLDVRIPSRYIGIY